jgi:hypothetical protein
MPVALRRPFCAAAQTELYLCRTKLLILLALQPSFPANRPNCHVSWLELFSGHRRTVAESNNPGLGRYFPLIRAHAAS